MSTLSEVAARAGVSLATASRALNGAPGRQVKPALLERVERAAAELNYIPNAGAQAMARGFSNLICLVVDDIADPYFGTIAAGAGRYAAENGLLLTIISARSNAAARTTALQTLTSQRVRGVILASDPNSDAPEMTAIHEAVETLRHNGTPVVTIGSSELGIPSVLVPNTEAPAELARELLAQGHRSFAILAGPKDNTAAQLRTKSFAAAVETGGGRVTMTLTGDFDRASAQESIHLLVGAGRLPDVIFATNDLQALGALRGLRAANLRIPGDVGLAAFGDSNGLSDAYPSITAVSIDADRAGYLAAGLLRNPESETELTVPHKVNLRESTERGRASSNRFPHQR